jgi:hypothetical protein
MPESDLEIHFLVLRFVLFDTVNLPFMVSVAIT